MKIVVIGASGMVGHTVAKYLEKDHEIVRLSLRGNVEYRPPGDEDLVINCAGLLVDECETYLDDAVYVNSYIPHMLEDWYMYSETKVIQISTDCVFDGTFYGRTKALGELENDKDLTLRMSLIGADSKPEGTGLFNWFMKQEGKIEGYEKAIWNGITTLQLAKSIIPAMDLVGIYNLVPEQGISKYSLLMMLNHEFDRGLEITPVKMGRDKTLPAGDVIPVPSYRTMIKEMKGWINEHPETYSHYLRK